MASASDIATARPERGLRLPVPVLAYVTVSVVLLGPWTVQYLADPLGFDVPSRDTWHHVAVLRELMAEPFAPSNPHIPTDEPSRYFTPLAVLAALFGRIFELSPYRLFGFLGAASCVGLVAGCWTFARRYYGSPWAPLALLLMLLFAWGAPLGHVGLHNYYTLVSSAGYPATIALVLGLLSWGYALRILQDGRPGAGALVALGALSATILLTHQLSGVIGLAGLGSLVLFADRAAPRSKALLLGAIALGCLAALAWPYFRILDVVSSVSDARWRSPNETVNDVTTMLVLMAPALFGAIGFRKPEGGLRWELLLPCAVFALGYALLALQGSAVAHRFPPGIVLFGQLGLVWMLLACGRSLARRGLDATRAVVAAGCAVVVVSMAVTHARRLHDFRQEASARSLVDTAEAIGAHLGEGSVAFATEEIVFPVQASGRRVVSIPRPEPAAPSLGPRQQATDRFFDADTGRVERQRLIDRWGATHVVLASADLEPAVISELRLLGPSTRFAGGVEVITIAPPPGAPGRAIR